MNISARTTICGLIGDPVEHSMSPAMQNAAFRELNLDYLYVAFRVQAKDVGSAIAGMRAMNIRGLNVTIPHKMAVIPFLDEVDQLAGKIGAVNTIVNEAGRLTGYNTDAEGFLRPLLERGLDLKGKRVLVVGAGGAARGITFALAEVGASLVILNRTAERARDLAAQLSKHFSGSYIGEELTEDRLVAAMVESDLVVNTTSVGMGVEQNETPIPAKVLRRDALIYDIVYNPLRTRLISEARQSGCQTIAGAEMLAWQGALALEKWTGQEAPIELMKGEVVRNLTDEK